MKPYEKVQKLSQEIAAADTTREPEASPINLFHIIDEADFEILLNAYTEIPITMATCLLCLARPEISIRKRINSLFDEQYGHSHTSMEHKNEFYIATFDDLYDTRYSFYLDLVLKNIQQDFSNTKTGYCNAKHSYVDSKININELVLWAIRKKLMPFTDNTSVLDKLNTWTIGNELVRIHKKDDLVILSNFIQKKTISLSDIRELINENNLYDDKTKPVESTKIHELIGDLNKLNMITKVEGQQPGIYEINPEAKIGSTISKLSSNEEDELPF